tara:strand:+ start:29553 stop:30623 length:1071 start_codon:yes stop_codon:yes gene_type:complete
MLIKLDFKFLEQKNYLIFDDLQLKIFNKYLDNSTNVISFRDNRLNFFGILYALIFFFRSELKIEYINFFLRFTKKKTIISSNYNRIILYKIKKYYPSIKIIIIQNGLINKFFIDKLKKNNAKLSCDYFLCMTTTEKEIIEKYINANFIVIGSFINNFFYKKQKRKKKEILFISQYRDKASIIDFQKSYYNTTQFLIPYLIQFSKDKKIPISILGSSLSFKKENNYYKNFFKSYKFKYYKRKNFLSYKRVDNSLIIVGVDSTLIYEAFSRGKKIAIFNFNKISKKFSIHDSFLFQRFLKDEGLFWTKIKSGKKIKNILNSLFDVSNNDWLKKKSNYKNLFLFDKDNKKFQNILYSIK